MIIDQLRNAGSYYGLNDRITKGFQYLQHTDFLSLEAGKYEIDGDNVYAFVQHYDTKPRHEAVWEAHRLYLDLQFVVAGKEKIGYANVQNMKLIQTYNEIKDSSYYEGEGSFIVCPPGTFVLLFPEDVHLPRIWLEERREPVIKVVMKILM